MNADELVDVVDEDDHVVGQARRSEVRRDGLWHRGVYIFVFNPAGKLFVHRRTESKDIFPGYWDVAVGGVVQAGEDYATAAGRELREELGVRGAPLRRLLPMRYDDGRLRVRGMVYSCTCAGRVRFQRSEIAAGKWLDLDVVVEQAQREKF
jgi:isopentenyldiphosphate isomerase